ncbi:MAG: hybrid sensor histidine kinase/response regulator [Cyanobacteria bacterium P01_D01_bin.156]
MALDKEQQARLTFLAEAETYFGDIESVLLGLKTAEDRPAQINIAMRAAHSVKGTAGMMGYVELSQTAHYLEDAFKILRARQLPVDIQLETLLLQGVDCLRHVRQQYQEEKPIDPEWLATDVTPILEQLNQQLGEFTPEDEAKLLSQENEVNLDFVIFTTSVDDSLNEFEQQLAQLKDAELQQALINASQQMAEFGLMAQLDSFVALCESIQSHSMAAQPEELHEIADQAIKAWRRSHSLVTLGRTERLPQSLKRLSPLEESLEEALDAKPPEIISDLPDELPALEDFPALELPSSNGLLTPGPAVDLEALQGQFAALAPPIVEPRDEQPQDATAIVPTTELSLVPLNSPPPISSPSATQTDTVRVSVEQLKNINSTFEALILNRNALNLRLEQLQTYSDLMQERMMALASFNQDLRQWYDQAATANPQDIKTLVASGQPERQTPYLKNSVAASDGLDALEFDRYSQLHLMAQEHMETIVKLEEVSQDIELGLNDIGQALSSLNYTSRTLQSRITQTQMRSFEEVVRRFPRVVRDWSVQYGKRVTVELEGMTTLIEQFALDQLSDPLMHLLRNAFDHGIEPPEVRQAKQKPAVGTIALKAINRGNQVVITLSDDGGGIDLSKVRDRIRQYNLPTDQIDTMDRQELLSFIFEPGFSTSGSVTELSGRGVGMDVVRNNIKKLQGTIEVNTEPGEGTTFTIRIPLSLSILRVMLLERNGSVFALPVDMVQEVIRSSTTEQNQSTIDWNNSPCSLVRLEEYWHHQPGVRPLEISGEPVINHPMVIVVGENNQACGFTIDRFWQEQEVAIRSVASPIPLPPGFSGVTVLGDGRVVPLIDPLRLMEWIEVLPETSSQEPLSILAENQINAARILVVDDSIHARRYLATTLERSGYLVEQAKDGREAVDKLSNGLMVEAVICDIEMPRLDGYGVLEELRYTPKFSDLPILMLTSRSNEKHRKLAMNLGATGYFSKPYNEQELLQQLQQLTQSKPVMA